VTDPFPAEVFRGFLSHPRQSGLFTDFDGTLSAIVDDPDRAQLVSGAAQVLDVLAGQLGRVGVLSGRPIDFLVPLVPRSVMLSGLYGLQKLDDGVRDDHPMGGAWREVTDDIASLAEQRGPEGMRVEDKDLSITLHYRGHPEIEGDVLAWAEKQAARSGLVVRRAKMSFELHPPIEADKCTSLLYLVYSITDVCFIGDDVCDEFAYDALDQLSSRGINTVRVAVAGAEAPSELIDRADVVVNGPDGVLSLLRRLSESVPARPTV
jgi:trehalose 6-phosphate phosphatase